jgi:hypothetical protein
MPPKSKAKKPKRIPHPNETPLKHKAPGHGAVERAKNQMWSEPSNAAQQTSGSNLPVAAKPKYKATPAISTIGIGIGRGGGGGVKKKKAVLPTVDTTMRKDVCGTGGEGRANPDSDFFGKPQL